MLYDEDRVQVKTVSLASPLILILVAMATGEAPRVLKAWAEVLSAGLDLRERAQALAENRARDGNTKSLSCHLLPAACLISSCCTWWSRSTSTQRCGSFSVRRDFLVLVSPPARTERQTMMNGGSVSRSTKDQVSARSSSVRAPVSSDSTM
jgi:hypothetical protein